MTRAQVSRLLLLTGGAALTLGLAVGWLLAGVAIDAAGVGALFWLAAAVMGGVAIAGLWSVHRLMRGFVVQVRDLADAGRIILAANPDYRARGGGHPDVAALAAVINALGAQLQELQQARAVAIQQARSDLEEERNLLAALMAELTDGVLVCNLDGQILLYNRGARALLDNRADANRADAQAGYVGLGRSVFSVLDRDALTHALDQVRARSTTDPVHEGAPGGEQMATTSLVATASNGRLLRLRLAPFAGAAGALRGYVLTLQDISEGIERSHRRDVLLQTLSERLRASVASMRAAIETLEQFPMLTATQQSRLQRVIRDEVTALSNNLNDTLRAYDSDLRAQWRLEEMHGSDLLWSIVRHLERRHGVTVQSDASDDALWLKVDSYTLLQGVSHLAAALAADFGIAALTLRLAAYEPAPGGEALKAANRPSQIANHPAFAALDIGWHAPGDDEAWQRWKARAYVVDATDGVLTLAEVAERHGGEVWFQRNGGQALAYFRLLLPRAGRTDARAAALSPAPGPRLESRPEYYDFDLFHQPGQRPELGRAASARPGLHRLRHGDDRAFPGDGRHRLHRRAAHRQRSHVAPGSLRAACRPAAPHPGGSDQCPRHHRRHGARAARDRGGAAALPQVCRGDGAGGAQPGLRPAHVPGAGGCNAGGFRQPGARYAAALRRDSPRGEQPQPGRDRPAAGA
jgi:DNA polymerase-3 subunit epsilon